MAVCLLIAPTSVFAADTPQRTVVDVPDDIRIAMADVMRQQLAALDAVMAIIATGDYGKAADVAEDGLGMTASARYRSERFRPYMPDAMRQLGGVTHKAGSRLSKVLWAADLQSPEEAHAAVSKALSELVSGCNGCHSAYGFK